MRLEDLLLAGLRAGSSPGHALAVAKAFLASETEGGSFATAFVTQYQSGVITYANAGPTDGADVNSRRRRLCPHGGGSRRRRPASVRWST